MTVRLERDLGEGSLGVKIVPIEDIAKVMGLNAEKVDDLPEGRIYFFSRHVNALCAAKPEATYCRDFVDGLDREDFVDESRLLQSCEQLLDAGGLVVHLLLRVLLEVELLLELVELSPKLPLIVLNVRPVALEGLYLAKLLIFFRFNLSQFSVQLSQLVLECFALLGLLRSLIPLQLCAL